MECLTNILVPCSSRDSILTAVEQVITVADAKNVVKRLDDEVVCYVQNCHRSASSINMQPRHLSHVSG